MEAKAHARQKEGEAEAMVIERSAAAAKAIQAKAEAQAEADEKLGLVAAKVTKEKGLADADVIEHLAKPEEKRGLAEARVIGEKFTVDAKGIEAKADAMKQARRRGQRARGVQAAPRERQSHRTGADQHPERHCCLRRPRSSPRPSKPPKSTSWAARPCSSTRSWAPSPKASR